ncbi:Gfo/Idh/MocA family oxidoreductase [Bacillus sp. JRC01]|nr:Gfo/Idh/MocA family oxidoreductase [Bacillus sp. JRC01]
MKIGIMSFAHMHAYSYASSLQKMKGVSVAGVFDEDEDRGRKAAGSYGTVYYPDQTDFLAQEMEAVIICSENSQHKDMVLDAAKAGKHILCEKPIATTLEDAQAMIDACEENGVILQVAFPVRFSRPMMELKERVDRGEIGEIVAFRSTNRGQNPGGWFIDPARSGGGAVLDHTVHMVDIMRWLTGKEVKEVDAMVDSFFHDIEIDDAGIMTLEFEGGIMATHDASWSRFDRYPTWGDATLEVIGTKKTIKADAFKEHYRLFSDGPMQHVFVGEDMDEALIRDFVDCIRKGRKPSITGVDGLKAVEVAMAAYRSSEAKRAVTL